MVIFTEARTETPALRQAILILIYHYTINTKSEDRIMKDDPIL